MVGTHSDIHFPLAHYLYQAFHHAVHINIAFKVIGFIKITIGIALGAAKVYEVDAVTKLQYHCGEIIIGPHPERTGAETKPVAGVGYSIEQLLYLLGGAYYPRQSENGIWRIIGVNYQFNTCFIGYRLTAARHAVIRRELDLRDAAFEGVAEHMAALTGEPLPLRRPSVNEGLSVSEPLLTLGLRTR